jgi:hypothetical protein
MTSINTAGVKTFSTAGRSVAKNAKPSPIPPGEYTGKLRAEHIAKKQKDGVPDAVPYIAYSIEVLGTELKEGGKNRLLFANIFPSLTPGKDGVLMIDRSNGLTALTKALGTELEGVEVVERTVELGDGSQKTIQYLNPEQIKEFLVNNVGVEFKLFVKVEPNTYNGETTDQNVVGRFIARDS